MMVLYSGTTDPYSHRCRFVLFEKGMDFEIRDVDLFAKPEDIALMNPYNEVPILVERDLILYESHIINEYIDERFPHPQLMPGDPVARARVRLFLFNFEKELFAHVNVLEGRGTKGTDKQLVWELKMRTLPVQWYIVATNERTGQAQPKYYTLCEPRTIYEGKKIWAIK